MKKLQFSSIHSDYLRKGTSQTVSYILWNLNIEADIENELSVVIVSMCVCHVQLINYLLTYLLILVCSVRAAETP